MQRPCDPPVSRGLFFAAGVVSGLVSGGYCATPDYRARGLALRAARLATRGCCMPTSVAGRELKGANVGVAEAGQTQMWHVVTYSRVPGREDFARLQRWCHRGLGLRHLRMVAVKVRTDEVERLAALEGVLSVCPGERAVFVPSPVSRGQIGFRPP